MFVLLDKSLSMVEEIDSVKEYVADELVGRLLIPGDLFVLINFYGKTDRFFSGEVESRADIEALKDSLTSITADGRFTDIGSALDTLEKTVEAIPVRQGRKRYLLLLTDGKQEAPPTAPITHPMAALIIGFSNIPKRLPKRAGRFISSALERKRRPRSWPRNFRPHFLPCVKSPKKERLHSSSPV